MNRTVLVLALSCAALFLSGCLIGASSRTEHTGHYVSQETLAKVQPGATKTEVAGILGEPSSKTPPNGMGEIWKWEYTEETRSEGSVFLLISSSKTSESAHTVYAEFKGDRLVKTWRD